MTFKNLKFRISHGNRLCIYLFLNDTTICFLPQEFGIASTTQCSQYGKVLGRRTPRMPTGPNTSETKAFRLLTLSGIVYMYVHVLINIEKSFSNMDMIIPGTCQIAMVIP